MYACLCNNIKDSEILDLKEKGIRDIKALQELVPIGKDCGCCLLKIKAILEEPEKEEENGQ